MSDLQQEYNQYAQQYNQSHQILNPDFEKILRKFISILPKDSLVLDLGCGNGRDMKFLFQNNIKVEGYDFSEEMIKIAKKNVPQANFSLKDIEKDLFPKQKYDGIIANCSLLHFPKNKISKIFAKIHQTIKKNGIFLVRFKAGSGEHELEIEINQQKIKRFFAFYSKKELKHLLEKKFKVLEIFTNQGKRGNWYIVMICQKI
ncbi:class I SAM-dependent methyltransferase [Candidatus Beckwithbacteria bacterium]|nr:class I SAM-dependent methyltransferase [Candidatus Beckwithbacteria bacterium]